MFSQLPTLATFALNQPNNLNPLEKKLYATKLEFSTLTADAIKQYTAEITQLYTDTYDAIAALQHSPDKITFKNTVQRLINLTIFTEVAKSLCKFTKEVHHDEALRDASTIATAELDKLIIECEQREDVFLVMQHYMNGHYVTERTSLGLEEIRYIEQIMHDYHRRGMTLTDQTKKARIKAIKVQISDLSIQFQKNIADDDTHFIMSTDELAGLPADWFTKEKETAPGMYKVTLKYTDYFPILDYATNKKTRSTLFSAYNARCMKENLPILKTILELRAEHAQLLGYQTHADYAAEEKMVRSADNAQRFMDDMNDRFTPLLQSNLKELTDFAIINEKDPTLELAISDIRYYMRLREEALCDINMESIKEYFPIQRVISGTLAIYAKLLGLTFRKNTTADVWHPDVECYDVYQFAKIGTFYLDLHPRDGKFSHAAVFNLQTHCDITHLNRYDIYSRPSAVGMVCNFPKNGNMPFSEVETFFHEFGHVMHYLCAAQRLITHNSFGVEAEFVEAPSQMFENWCYEKQALDILSSHVTTGQPLPQEMAQKLQMKNQLHAGYIYKRQLLLSYLDYNLHRMSADQLKQLDLEAYTHHLQENILQLPALPNTCLLASFGHIADDYDAGYYGYLYSETQAADMFDSLFKNDPLSPALGAIYYRTILLPGSSKDAMDMLKNLLGREPTIDAFLERCGLTVSPPVKSPLKIAYQSIRFGN